MTSYIEDISSLIVGTVESVAPNEFRVLLDSDAPQTTALNATVPRGFPRLNGYVLIPNEIGAIVAVVTWIGIERSHFPKISTHKDFGLVDLPFPVRRMVVSPLGTLRHEIQQDNPNRLIHKLSRGVSIFPSVGDKVLLPTIDQLRSIIEGGGEANGVKIGTSSSVADAKVSVDPDKIFGRHLAVLGNTGSGKSCTVAGLIHWTLEQAQKARNKQQRQGPVNARFIVLDPNGEYRTAFQNQGARVYCVSGEIEEADAIGAKPLQVPAWLWNAQEWTAFTGAKPGVQRPLLLQALRELKAGAVAESSNEVSIRRLLTFFHQKLLAIIETPSQYVEFPGVRNTGQLLENIAQTCTDYALQMELEVGEKLQNIASLTAEVVRRRKDRGGYFSSFVRSELEILSGEFNSLMSMFGAVETLSTTVDANSPIQFDTDSLPDYLEELSRNESSSNSGYVQNLSMRIRTLLSDTKLRSIISPNTDLQLNGLNHTWAPAME